jgi:hypothetical protein
MSIDEIEGSAADSAAEEAKGISLLRQAEKRREQQADTLFLEVPTWGGDLIAEYKVIDRHSPDTLVRKMQQQARGGNPAMRRRWPTSTSSWRRTSASTPTTRTAATPKRTAVSRSWTITGR